LIEKGMSREAAYAAVQRSAMRAWSEHGDFLALLKQDREIAQRLNEGELEGLFELAYHLKHVDRLFSRVFGDVQP